MMKEISKLAEMIVDRSSFIGRKIEAPAIRLLLLFIKSLNLAEEFYYS